MNLNIKTKIILNVALVIICSILLFTAIVSVMLWEQTERKAQSNLLLAANIVAERIHGKSISLKKSAVKIATSNELANLANFIQESQHINSMKKMIEEDRKSLAISLYSISLTAGIPQITLYGTDEKWICHIDTSATKAKIVIPSSKNREKFLQATTIKGEMPTNNQWKEIRIAPIPLYSQSPLPLVPESGIEETKNTLWITSKTPLMTSDLDINTFKQQERQIGSIQLRIPIGNSFTRDIFNLTSHEINLYLNGKYVAGNFPSHKEIDISSKPRVIATNFDNVLSDKTEFSVINIYEKPFFAGIIPIVSKRQVVGHFALFLSQEETQRDLNQIIKTLLLAALLIILLSVAASLITARSIAQPILDLIRVMRRVEEKGDLSIKAKSNGISEIALAGRAFNSLISEFQKEITDRKKAEIKLADNNISIEDKIASRTTELERKTHELAKSNKNISNFLITMSHEIRTPMNAVLGMLQLLSETELAKGQGELIDVANDSGTHLISIVNDILELSQITSGKIAIEDIPFDIKVLTEDIVDVMANIAHTKRLNLSCLISAEIPQKVSGDPTKLRQILNNLIGNVIKFTENGDILIKVMLDDIDHNQISIRFEIVDTGLRPDIAEKQFLDSINLAAGESNLRPEETGLGITICSQLVSKLGGDLKIKTDSEKGSQFIINIKFALCEAEEQHLDSDLNFIGKKTLLVDSMPANSLIIQQQLNHWGIDCQVTDSEAEAKQLLLKAFKSNQPFDLVLVDLHSPQIQGVNLSNWISSNQNLSQTKQIFLTLKGYKGDAEIVRNAGVHGYLSTPIKEQHLYKCISMVFGLSSNTRTNLITKHMIKEGQKRHENKALLIDSNIENLKTLSSMLKSYGISSDIYTDSKNAAQMISNCNYSIVFIESHIPGFDAAGLTQIFKNIKSSSRQIPIYAQVFKPTAEELSVYENSKLDGYLNKPIQHADLKQVLDKHFNLNLLKAEVEQNEQRKLILLHESPDSLDISTILSLRSLIPKDRMEEFIIKFFDSCINKIKQMESSIETNDDNQLIFTVHSLKRSCANMGATKIAGLCHLIESHFARNGFDANIIEMIAKLEDEIQKLRHILPKELGVI